MGVLVSCPRGPCRTGCQQAQGATAAPLRRDVAERKQAQTRSRTGPAASRPTLRSGASILETGSTASLVPLSSFRDPPLRRLVGKGDPSFDLFLFLFFSFRLPFHFVLGK